MLIRVFKSNFPGLVIGLFIVLAVFWVDAIIFASDTTIVHGDKAFFFALIENALVDLPYLNIILALFIVFANALLISNLISEFELLTYRTYIPALLYITFMCSSHTLMSLTPVALSSFFMLLTFKRIFKSYNDPDNLIEVLNIGLLTGLATLFYLPSMFYLVFVWIALLVFQSFSARRWLITILGFLTPFVFLLVYLFVFDKLDIQFLLNFTELLQLPSVDFQSIRMIDYLTIAYFFIVVVISFFTGIFKLQEKIIRTRKMFTVFTWYFIVTLLHTVFSYNMLMSSLFIFIPLSLFVTNYFFTLQKKWIAEFWYFLLLAIILANKLNFFA